MDVKHRNEVPLSSGASDWSGLCGVSSRSATVLSSAQGTNVIIIICHCSSVRETTATAQLVGLTLLGLTGKPIVTLFLFSQGRSHVNEASPQPLHCSFPIDSNEREGLEMVSPGALEKIYGALLLYWAHVYYVRGGPFYALLLWN